MCERLPLMLVGKKTTKCFSHPKRVNGKSRSQHLKQAGMCGNKHREKKGENSSSLWSRVDAGNGRTGASAWQPGGGEEHRVLTLCRRKEESEFEAACVCAMQISSETS